MSKNNKFIKIMDIVTADDSGEIRKLTRDRAMKIFIGMLGLTPFALLLLPDLTPAQRNTWSLFIWLTTSLLSREVRDKEIISTF